MAVAQEKHHVLACTCGDCLHWEIIHDGNKFAILCKTCNTEFAVTSIVIPESDNLNWVERDKL